MASQGARALKRFIGPLSYVRGRSCVCFLCLRVRITAPMSSPNDRPSDEELRLFLERIARRLAEQPVGLDAPAHREKVAALLRKSGEASFYQMLALQPTASALEVHEAYERTARLLHP